MVNTSEVEVWDLFVRVFHWSLVAGFFTAYLVEDELLGLHVWAGYTVFSLVVLRIVWGVIGSVHARFGDFVRGPGETLAYLKQVVTFAAPRHLGHNPAGGAMIVALLLSLLAITLSGMVMFGAESGTGPLGGLAALFGVIGEEAAEGVKEVHEFFVNLTLFLIGLHVAGVLLATLAHRENLVRAMFTGRKQV